MEKKAQLYEIIIKSCFALFSFIAAIFIIKNMLSMFPLYTSFSSDQLGLFELIYNTHIGEILKDIGPVHTINFKLILKGFACFLLNLEWIASLFLLLTLALLVLKFIFIKWSLVGNYLKLSGLLILAYVLKYLMFLLCFALFYKGGESSLALSFVIGTSLYLLLSLGQLIILSLWIIKFIFNIVGDIIYYLKH